MKKKPCYKLTRIVITKLFCQFLGPSLYRGCTVLNFIYLLIFQKVGVGLAPRAPPPVRVLTEVNDVLQ